jgi:transposase-like protein
MSQHFLLTAKARSLSIRQIFSMTDSQAFELFKELRWGSGEETACPDCGSFAKHYFIKSREQWRCRDCNHTYSVTSGTLFAFHKLPLRIYLGAISIYANAAKGLSALQLSRDLNVQYKTAFVMAHKIRQSLIDQRVITQLEGEVHMDGAYVNTYIKPRNKKSNRIDRRLAKHQNLSKRCVFVMRQKCQELASRANKTLTFVLKSENQADISQLVNAYVASTATICADESDAYDTLHAKFDTRRVNHSKEYKSDEGITNNIAESYFSRFRRMQIGQMHKFGILYLANYANEAAYREDTRRWCNGAIFTDIATKCASTRTHRDWCGYWQGNKRKEERLAS